MKKVTLFLFTILTLSQLTCTKDAFTGFIHPEMRPFIEDFIEEGKKRGVEFDIEEIESFLVNEFSVQEGVSETACGLGWYDYEHNKRRIEVLNTDRCWGSRSRIEKENFMFHELGHAFLERDHIGRTFPNNYPKSIMCSTDQGLDCSNFTVYHDTEPMRTYYLDELFNENAPLPEYTNKNEFIRTVFKGDAQEHSSNWELFIVNDPDNISNFQFSQDTSSTGMPTLKITTDGSSLSPPASVTLVNRFEITDVPSCSNLKAFSDIRVEGLTDGEFQVGLSLRERVTVDSLNRFHLGLIKETSNGFYENYLHELYCLSSEKTDVVSISFALESSTAASVTIDNLLIDLYE